MIIRNIYVICNTTEDTLYLCLSIYKMLGFFLARLYLALACRCLDYPCNIITTENRPLNHQFAFYSCLNGLRHAGTS